MYTIKYSKQAINALRKMPNNLSRRIREKLKLLAIDPYSNKQVKLLKGSVAYRIRVGDWRILYLLNKTQVEIAVIKIATRGEVYKL